MAGLTRRAGSLYGRTEDSLGRLWLVWAAALVFYAGAAFVILTKVRLPTPLHLLVFVMAAAVIVLTVIRIEWAIMGLAVMIPFARPGFTVGYAHLLHVSGFNVAVVGVWIAYLFRYMTDRESIGQGPLVRRTPIDMLVLVYLFFATMSTFVGLNAMSDPQGKDQILLFYKDQVLFVAWFYLVFTLLRTPGDLRRFGVLLASSGLLVAAIGLYARVRGAAASIGVPEDQLEGGVVGGRIEGGWLGLVHPNFYGAFLIVSTPIWFFAVDHLKKVFHRLLASAAILLGLVGLLFTYSRSSWIGFVLGIGTQAVTHGRTFRRVVAFLVLFAVVAQALAYMTTGMGFVDLIQIRFEQLERSGFSSRPAIYAAAFEILRKYPILGVGGGALRWYAPGVWEGGILAHAHNVVLAIATEYGIPAAIAFAGILIMFLWTGAQNVRRLLHVPGYGFLAQGTFVGMLALTVQCMFEHILFSRDVGYALFGVGAVILGLNRCLREGTLPPAPQPAGAGNARSAGIWKEA